MARGPDERLVRLSDAEAERLARFYAEAEQEITNEINKALLRGNKTEYLKAMQTNCRAILADLEAGSRQWCEQAIPRIYTAGTEAAGAQIEKAGGKLIRGFGAIHQQAVQALAETAFNRFDDTNIRIGRRVDDIYRTLALENVRGSVTGYKGWQQVARSFRDQLAERGVTGFKDAKDRHWNMKAYTEMVARTTTMEAHLEGTKNRLLEHGHDLIKVSTHSNACDKCRPWEGKVLSLSGETKGYPTLHEAKVAGLFHPRCKHAYGLYIDLDEEIAGAKKKPKAPAKSKVKDKEPSKYYTEIKGLPKKAKEGLAKTFEEALEHGKKTGNECLLHIGSKNGDVVYSKISGGKSSVKFPPRLIEFLNTAEKDSIIQIHNHPRSSSFSPADVSVLVRFMSISNTTVIGHDGTRYLLGIGEGLRPNIGDIEASYKASRAKYYDRFNDDVRTGKLTGDIAWKEHSHLIMQDLAHKYGWDYRRVMPNER